MSTTRFKILIISTGSAAIMITVVAAVLFAFGATGPTVASNVAGYVWIVFAILVVTRAVTRAVTRRLDALDAKVGLKQALDELVTTGPIHRPQHLRAIDNKVD